MVYEETLSTLTMGNQQVSSEQVKPQRLFRREVGRLARSGEYLNRER